jgi:hypothetical protein
MKPPRFGFDAPVQFAAQPLCRGRAAGEKIFKSYALKYMDEVYSRLEEAALYIERNLAVVKSITTFPYVIKSI